GRGDRRRRVQPRLCRGAGNLRRFCRTGRTGTAASRRIQARLPVRHVAREIVRWRPLPPRPDPSGCASSERPVRRTIRTFQSPDGNRRLEFYCRSDGLFSFAEFFLDTEDLRSHGLGVETYWALAGDSGIYASLEEAERDAIMMTPWFG